MREMRDEMRDMRDDEHGENERADMTPRIAKCDSLSTSHPLQEFREKSHGKRDSK